jgi:hypothetical protein
MLLRGVSLGALMCGGILLAGVACAGEQRYDGQPRVEFVAALVDSVHEGAVMTLRLIAAAPLDSAIVRVIVPPGVDVVDGDTVRTMKRGTVVWALRLRMQTRDTIAVRGLINTVGRRGGDDEVEWKLSLAPGMASRGQKMGGTIVSQVLRNERVVEGKRFRLAGGYVVPIEERENFTAGDVERGSVKGRPEDEASVIDSTGEVETASDVMVIVFVDRHGKVVGAQAPRGAKETPALKAAMKAVRSWSFRPTMFRGRAISDWVTVTVHVEPRPQH